MPSLPRVRWTLGAKLGAAFAAVVAVFVVALAVAVHLNGTSQTAWRELLRWDQGERGIAHQVEGTRVQMAAQALYAATFEPKYKAEWERGVAIADAGAKQAAVVADPTITRVARSAQAADHLHDENVHNRLFPAVARGDHAAALEALKLVDRYVREPLKAQQQISGYIVKHRQDAQDRAEAATSRARTVSFIAIGLGVLLAAAIALLFARSLVRRIRSVGGAADRLALGDIEQDLTIRGQDEVAATARAFGGVVESFRHLTEAAEAVAGGDLTVDVQPRSERDALGHAFRTMIERLRELVERMSSAAAGLSAASEQMAATSEEAGRAVGEIAHAVDEVASGAERQVRVIESARTTAEQVAAASGSNAEDARETAAAADEARRVAQEGADAVRQATEAMELVSASSTAVSESIKRLSDKSSEIGGIVQTITSLTEQTNLLALNAAIEAARAGEQGRGFAVVAEEVGKLAEESGRAAASIAGLIDDIQAETAHAVATVEDGARRTAEGGQTVAEARASFQRIDERVHDVDARVERIASAIDQIADGTRRINDDIAEVATVAEQSSAASQEVSASTQLTSASAQQVSSSARELATTAEELARLVHLFKL